MSATESFVLPNLTPGWALLLGLRLDWQSRVTDPERTYHSSDRAVELTVGRWRLHFALEVCQWEDHTSLHLEVPGLIAFWKVARGASPPAGEMSREWGVQVYEGDLILHWGERRKRWQLNPFRWDGFELACLRADGVWDTTPHYSPEGKAIEWYVEEHPYSITSLPSYRNSPAVRTDPHFEIERWDATAICQIERTVRTRRWLPFLKRVEFWVKFRLSDEIGPGKGSWKGGAIGFNEQMLPGDKVEDVVQRAARKGRGR